jgi:hypothetical protein
MGSFLYVIGPDPQNVHAPWIKIGRSASPALRRSQLQVGQQDTLKVWSAFPVRASEASKREAAVHQAMAPLRIKGEVFRCRHEIGSAFTEHFSNHSEADEFLCHLLVKDLAEKEWGDLIKDRSGFKRSNTPQRIEDAIEAAQAAMDEATKAIFALNFDRAAKTDEIMAHILRPKPKPASIVPKMRVLTSRQPRTGPSLFRRGGRTA